jgi:hypothetical protein
MENSPLPLEKELEPIFTEKLPAFPENIKDILVQVAPWLALIGGIIGVLSLLTALGATTVLSFGAFGNEHFSSPWYLWVGILWLGALTALCIISFKPLQNKEKKAWKYMYWLTLIGLVFNILSFSWISGLFSAFISFWILFQLKSRYTN